MTEDQKPNEFNFNAIFGTDGLVNVISGNQIVSDILHEVSSGINNEDRGVRIINKNYQAKLNLLQFGQFVYWINRRKNEILGIKTKEQTRKH